MGEGRGGRGEGRGGRGRGKGEEWEVWEIEGEGVKEGRRRGGGK